MPGMPPNSCMLGTMDKTITAVERAFQLARSSACTSVKDIKERLMVEGYAANQISGRSLSKQLAALIKARNAPKPPSHALKVEWLKALGRVPNGPRSVVVNA